MGVVLLEVAGSSLFEESSGKGRKAVADQGGQKMVGQESSPKSITSMERKSKSVVVDLKNRTCNASRFPLYQQLC